MRYTDECHAGRRQHGRACDRRQRRGRRRGRYEWVRHELRLCEMAAVRRMYRKAQGGVRRDVAVVGGGRRARDAWRLARASTGGDFDGSLPRGNLRRWRDRAGARRVRDAIAQERSLSRGRWRASSIAGRRRMPLVAGDQLLSAVVSRPHSTRRCSRREAPAAADSRAGATHSSAVRGWRIERNEGGGCWSMAQMRHSVGGR